MVPVELLEKEVAMVIPSPHALLETQCEFFDEHPELMDAEHLNNFNMRMPGSIMREQMKSRSFAKRLPNTDVMSSKLRLSQTPLEFWQTIDDSIAESGIDMDKLSQILAQEEAASEKDKTLDFERLQHELRQIILPVYKILRAKGYNTYDLIG